MSSLNEHTGREYWRSLDERAGAPEYVEQSYREFPDGAAEPDNNNWSRRNFLTLMGASLALAGLNGCRRPVEKVVPYAKQPEEITVGVPLYYATAMPFGLGATGLLVKCNEGRPTKIEGNPTHSSSGGAATTFEQASILDLYDPDRSRFVRTRQANSTWEAFVTFWRDQLKVFGANQGEGLAVLAEPFRSPSLYRLREEFARQFPKASWFSYAPISDENIYAGMRLAFGRPMQPWPMVDRARVIVCLDSDLLHSETEHIRSARGFADGRRVITRQDDMNRLYVAESHFTVTGSMADHRFKMPSSQIAPLTVALARKLNSLGTGHPVFSGLPSVPSPISDEALTAMAQDLIQNRGKSLVSAGRRQPAQVHALVAVINEALGNLGTTIEYYDVTDALVPDRSKVNELRTGMQMGSVNTLVFVGGNPAYDFPAGFDFDTLLKKVPHSIHLASHDNETSRLCEWHVPMAHYLESWSDVRSADGTPSVVQPMIEPLYGGKSALELLNLVATGRDQRGYELVRETWKKLLPALQYENAWRKVLHDGWLPIVNDSVTVRGVDSAAIVSAVSVLAGNADFGAQPSADKMEFVFAPSQVFDGRFANNGWLQELPDPITKLTWDNVAGMSQATATVLGVKNEDVVRVSLGGRTIDLPVWVCPGQADNSILLPLGYGRTAAGKVGNGVGSNTYQLRGLGAFDFGIGLEVVRTDRTMSLSTTQAHWNMEGRPLVREATLEEFRSGGSFKPEQPPHPPLVPLWDEHSYTEGYQWGMSIDLNACIGCNACTVACQSENNVPIVGKEQVRRGREMHWIRLDRYYAGDIDNPEIVHQPVACQHCENAPCEQVCPVAATVHDREGLNVMVYNRCIGTRYCSNNCPFKVRRFNFFNYTKDLPETVQMQQNPDVTVRSRGVMEKCTYCVQRLSAAKITAKREGKELADGDVVTACQQACPAKAIVFGNVNDPNSQVAKLRTVERSYEMLKEFNLRTRTTYLARLRNPNPDLAKLGIG